MAHAITLTDGVTTVNLYNTAGTFPTDWSLAAADEGEETVGEALDLLITATTAANLQTAVRTIETLLDDAARRERTRVGARVFLTVQWDGEASAWRSEVVGGRLEVAGAPDQYSRLKVEATLGLTRRAWWEGPETQIPLANSNGSGTSARTVYNCNDGTGTAPNKRENWVQIAAADVVGALPAPVKIELQNIDATATTFNAVHLAVNAFSDPANFGHWIEAESRTSGGTVVAEATYSSGNNQVQQVGHSSPATLTFTLAAATLQKAQGRWFRLLLWIQYRTATAAQVQTVQAQIYDAGNTVLLWQGPEVLVSLPLLTTRPVIDMGAIPLPPSGYGSNWGALTLRIIYKLASGTASTYTDWLQFTPMDSYRILSLRWTSVAANAYIVDNGYEGVAYVDTAGVRSPHVLAQGEPLMVFPGRLQRIILTADSGDFWFKYQPYAMRAWYRPRRLSI